MTTRYYLLHCSGKFYGRDANGAFCSTNDPNEIYYWDSREEAEANQEWQASRGYFHTVEQAQF